MRPIGSSNGNGLAPDPDNHVEATAQDPQEISVARNLIIEKLRSWRCARLDDIALVLSELITNAVTHAGGALLICATRSRDGHHVRLEVHDGVPDLPAGGDAGPGGYGLHIVDVLADRWGTTPTASGKLVWVLISV